MAAVTDTDNDAGTNIVTPAQAPPIGVAVDTAAFAPAPAPAPAPPTPRAPVSTSPVPLNPPDASSGASGRVSTLNSTGCYFPPHTYPQST